MHGAKDAVAIERLTLFTPRPSPTSTNSCLSPLTASMTRVSWWVAGRWAIDLILGHQSAVRTRIRPARYAPSVRVLVTTTPGRGHYHPMLPLAHALAASGHDVLWAAHDEVCQRLRAQGFDARAAGLAEGRRA